MVETRQITQVLIWKLILNPMRGNTENANMVAWSDDKQKLIDWYNNQFASEPYYSIGEHYFPAKGSFPENNSSDYRYYKVFNQGSPLEWHNPADSLEQPNHYGQGLQSEWVENDILPKINVGFRVW